MTRLPLFTAVRWAADLRPIEDIEQEISDELEFHLQMRTLEHIESALPAEVSWATAIAKFGDVARIHRECRRALLGERIMWQRMQTVLTILLLAAVTTLAAQLYSGQRANQAALADITVALKQMSEVRAKSEPATPAPNLGDADRPIVVETTPKSGDTEVDPALDEIRVKFSKPMADNSWSWVQVSIDSFPASNGDVHYLDDGMTCVWPVKLEPGKKYVVWFNSASYHNFKDRDGRPAKPFMLTFTTRK
ncbi:MAG TPA: permease prefix domain 1-containing protein [Lacipirellulaceae bacterium]|jgi:hypothetical protein|nr:permease prefix domain 1-containing protein [Lacipirellulaceae bacterium]